MLIQCTFKNVWFQEKIFSHFADVLFFKKFWDNIFGAIRNISWTVVKVVMGVVIQHTTIVCTAALCNITLEVPTRVKYYHTSLNTLKLLYTQMWNLRILCVLVELIALEWVAILNATRTWEQHRCNATMHHTISDIDFALQWIKDDTTFKTKGLLN